MTRIELVLPKPHTAQQAVLDTAKRFNVLDCGRRWGKTQLMMLLASKVALGGKPVGWFAPTYKVLQGAFDEMRILLAPVIASCNKTERYIRLITGGTIEFWTLQDENAGRSRKYALVIVDEAAMEPKLLAIWQNAIRPTLADYQGIAWFVSTPKGRNGFWQLWQRGMSGDYSEWMAWPSQPTSSNPYIQAVEIEAARKGLPDRSYRQEWLGEFMEDAGGVFRGVIQASTATPSEPVDGRQYIFGIDWGKKNDWTVIQVFDVEAKKQVWQDRFNKIDYHYQRKRVEALYNKYKPTTIIAETNSMGEPVIDELRRSGLPVRGFTTTAATKAQIIEGLALAIENNEVELLNDIVQINELQAYEMTKTVAGNIRYNAPSGIHDDTVMSLAFVVDGLGRYSGSMFIFGGEDWD